MLLSLKKHLVVGRLNHNWELVIGNWQLGIMFNPLYVTLPDNEYKPPTLVASSPKNLTKLQSPKIICCGVNLKSKISNLKSAD